MCFIEWNQNETVDMNLEKYTNQFGLQVSDRNRINVQVNSSPNAI